MAGEVLPETEDLPAPAEINAAGYIKQQNDPFSNDLPYLTYVSVKLNF